MEYIDIKSFTPYAITMSAQTSVTDSNKDELPRYESVIALEQSMAQADGVANGLIAPAPVPTHVRLLRMDSGLPRHRLCSVCQIFHPKRASYGMIVGGESSSIPEDIDDGCNERRIALETRFAIGWPSIQLVMRAANLGPDHGLPVSSLAVSWSDNQWQYETDARIVKDRLLIRVEATKTLDYAGAKYLQGVTESALRQDLKGLPLCRCPSSRSMTYMVESLIDIQYSNTKKRRSRCVEILLLRRVPYQCGRCEDMHHYCTYCGTEYDVECSRRVKDTNVVHLKFVRLIDAGPLKWVRDASQFASSGIHPVYGSQGDRLDQDHPCCREESDLFTEWYMAAPDARREYEQWERLQRGCKARPIRQIPPWLMEMSRSPDGKLEYPGPLPRWSAPRPEA